MKKSLLIALSLGAVAAQSASAQVVVNITGATAFREAAHDAIKATFEATPPVQWAYTGSNLGNANQAIFVGKFPGIAGNNTIVRTGWSGSVEGIKDVLNQTGTETAPFLPTSQTVSPTGTANATGTISNFPAVICFADNFADSTPYPASALAELNALSNPVGVIAFVPVATTNAPAALTNITRSQFNALYTGGQKPIGFFTGNNSTTPEVFATGRNDGSGTRVIYLAESGAGFFALVQQWRATSSGSVITDLRFWPTSDGSNASTIYNADTEGNGGYNSSSTLRSLMSNTTNTTVNLRLANNTIFATTASPVLITSMAAPDAQVAQAAGAKVLAWNGVVINPEPPPTGLSAADRAKIINGSYTLWSYEHMFYNTIDANTNDVIVFNAVQGNVPTNIGAAGVPFGDMIVGRSSDGGLVQ
jgi:hypothetical protein